MGNTEGTVADRFVLAELRNELTGESLSNLTCNLRFTLVDYLPSRLGILNGSAPFRRSSVGRIAVNRPTGFAGARPFHLRMKRSVAYSAERDQILLRIVPHQLQTGIWLWCSLKCR
jgi:hypothetical protein